MRPPALASVLALLVTLAPAFAVAERPSVAFNRIWKQRQLAMQEKGINELDMLKVLYVGLLTYQRGVCGEEVVPSADIEKVWQSYKVEAIVNNATKNAEVEVFVDALQAQFPDWTEAGRRGYCDSVTERLVKLKTELRLN